MILLAVAGWSVAEAILFFLVADVAISFVALRRGWRSGVAAALGTAAISSLLGRRLGLRARFAILAAFWLLFYGWYFAIMPG